VGQYIGIDLAWSNRARTGLAALSSNGRLTDSATVTTNAEIAACVAAVDPEPEVVAIDAPLVVPNETGQRACERLITSAFGRYHAGAHTSNRSRPYFNPPRAELLARDAGWAVDPEAAGPNRCIEVYPHPAMVGQWELPRVIPYKAKSGRSVDARVVAFVELLTRIEGIPELAVSANARWRDIRTIVEGAVRHAELERVEDEIDAIFCAYLAWLWDVHPDRLQAYGSLEEGYIVAPHPPTHASTPTGIVTSAPTGVDRGPSVSFDILGRPTGYASGENERRWKTSVQSSAVAFPADSDARFGLELRFRLDPTQVKHLEPDLDNLIKSTIDALERVLGVRPGNHRQPQADDVRVNEIVASKTWAASAEEAGVRITVRHL